MGLLLKQIWYKALTFIGTAGLSALTVYLLMRKSKEEKYEEAVDDIATEAQEDADKFAKAVQNENENKIAGLLSDLERSDFVQKCRKLQDASGDRKTK